MPRSRAKKMLLDSYETILDVPGIETLPSPLRLELQEEKDTMGEPLLSSAMQAPVTSASLSYDRPWDGGEVDFSMFGPLGTEPQASPAMRSPPPGATDRMPDSSAARRKSEPRTPITSPIETHRGGSTPRDRGVETEDEGMDSEEREETSGDSKCTTPRHTSPVGSAGKRLPPTAESPVESDHELPLSDHKDRWSIEQMKSPEMGTSASKEYAPAPAPLKVSLLFHFSSDKECGKLISFSPDQIRIQTHSCCRSSSFFTVARKIRRR
jgi:hypothetical protein